jgi:hypothetical protein
MPKVLWLTIFACAIMGGENYWDNFVNVKKEGQEYRVFADTAWVRLAPGNKKAKSFTLKRGDRVSVLAKTDVMNSIAGTREYWYEIETDGKKGYLWGGTLADCFAEIDSLSILVRNTGVQKKNLEIKAIGPDYRTSLVEYKSGPVDSDNGITINELDTRDFDPAPRVIFFLGFFAFSEIEMGYDCRVLCTVTGDGVLKTQFCWLPSTCDPPACAETFILFPRDSLPAMPETQRAGYHGIKNGIRLIDHYSELDDPTAHDYFVKDYLWNGAGFDVR